MSTEAHVYIRRHQGAKVKHFDVSNVIYHKFSHGAVSYTLNVENVNVMLEYIIKNTWNKLVKKYSHLDEKYFFYNLSKKYKKMEFHEKKTH